MLIVSKFAESKFISCYLVELQNIFKVILFY